MRVRNSPFGGSGGQQGHGAPMPPAQPAGQAAGQDFFDSFNFNDPTTASAPPSHMQPPGQPQHQQPFQQFQQPPQPPQQFQQPQQQFQQPQQQFQQPVQQSQQQQQPFQQFQQAPQAQQGQGQGMGAGPNLANAGAAALGSMGMGGGFNEAMANMALNQGMQQLQQSGVMRWFPGLFVSMQQLFNVGHSFVFRKLLVLMCPFIPSKSGQGQGSGGPMWSDSGSSAGTPPSRSAGPDGLKMNVEEPDLYIPLMAYTTYIIVYGLQRGIQSDFRPQVLSSTASFAMVLMLLEVGVAKMGFYVSGSSVQALDLLANCSYKYVPLCMMILARIVTGTNPIYYIFFAYLVACAGWALRRFLLNCESSASQEQYGVVNSALRGHVILGLAVAQLPLCWLLTPSASSAANVAAAAAAATTGATGVGLR